GGRNPGCVFSRTPMEANRWQAVNTIPKSCYADAAGDVWAQETEIKGQMKRVHESARLIIADDHPLFRGALREAVSGLFEEVEIAEAGSFEDVAKLLERGGEGGLILLGLTMPGVRGFSGLMYLRAQYSSVPVVGVSANDDPRGIRPGLDFGAFGSR